MELRFQLADGTACTVQDWYTGRLVRVVREGILRFYQEIWDAPDEVVDAFEQAVQELECDGDAE